jgi:hypothetical protein
LDLNEIIEKLQKIKADIEDAFEKELIDFDDSRKLHLNENKSAKKGE